MHQLYGGYDQHLNFSATIKTCAPSKKLSGEKLAPYFKAYNSLYSFVYLKLVNTHKDLWDNLSML